MDVVLGWLGKAAATQALSALVKSAFKDELPKRLDAAAEKWRRELPPEAELHSVAMFLRPLPTGVDSPSPATEIYDRIKKGELPTSDDWFACLARQWVSVRVLVPDPQGFFQLLEEDAHRHLAELSRLLHLECQRDRELFQVAALDLLQKIDEKLVAPPWSTQSPPVFSSALPASVLGGAGTAGSSQSTSERQHVAESDQDFAGSTVFVNDVAATLAKQSDSFGVPIRVQLAVTDSTPPPQLREHVERPTVLAALQTSFTDHNSVCLIGYERNDLRGKQLLTARRVIESRKIKGKRSTRGAGQGDRKVSADEVLRTYQRETHRQRCVIQKAKITETRLVFAISALRQLFEDENFVNLLRAESLDTLPQFVATQIHEARMS